MAARPDTNTLAGVKGFVSRPLAERFWEKVQVVEGEDACWPWLGSVMSRNPARAYGMLRDKGRLRPASQIAWELAHGEPFPAGLLACHKCDNPRCVRASHIFPGTMSDNLRDALAKGRLPCIRKTHCKRGHPIPDDSIRNRYLGCLICNRERQREKRALARAALGVSGEENP